jgi:hypothetical protein
MAGLVQVIPKIASVPTGLVRAPGGLVWVNPRVSLYSNQTSLGPSQTSLGHPVLRNWAGRTCPGPIQISPARPRPYPSLTQTYSDPIWISLGHLV